MAFILGFIFGALAGLMITCIISYKKIDEARREACHKGYQHGKEMVYAEFVRRYEE